MAFDGVAALGLSYATCNCTTDCFKSIWKSETKSLSYQDDTDLEAQITIETTWHVQGQHVPMSATKHLINILLVIYTYM